MLEGLVEIHGDLEEEVPHREVLAKQTGRLVTRRETKYSDATDIQL